MKPQSLTREKILAFLAAQPYPPSIREIGDHVGLRSSSTVHSHLCKLKAAGLITWRKSGLRTVRLTNHEFYTEDDWRQAVAQLEGIRKLEERHGLSNVSSVGHLVTLPSGHMANALHELKRLRGFTEARHE
jgi:SOS-response transcriptional repressor LexA